MEKKFDVIGVEDPIMDFAMQINEIPKTDSFTMIHDYSWQGGGNASSAIIALARLNAKTAIVGKVGSDVYGTFCREDMERHGVDTSHLKTMGENTTLCVCLAEKETQGRSFLGWPGTNIQLSKSEVDEEFIKQAKAIHLSAMLSDSQKYALEFAKKHGVLVSFDGGGYSPQVLEFAKKTDILIVSEHFYKGVFGDDENYIENCKTFLKDGAKVVIVTLGKKGCVGVCEDEEFELDIFKKENFEIIDTTGAGDVFHGGFLYAYLNRYKAEPYNYTLKDCARLASAVAFINCNPLGGRAGLPTCEMVDEFLSTGDVDLSSLQERKDFYRTSIFGCK